MEVACGIAFKDFAIVATDSVSVNFGILMVKHNLKKMYHLTDKLLMGVNGETGDTDQFAEYVEKNIQLYKIRNGFELSPKAAATWIQRTLASYLRSRTPYTVNLIIAGYDDENGAELYYIDNLATMNKVPYALHGYAMMFGFGVIDKLYNENMNEQEAYELMKRILYQLNKRVAASVPVFNVKIVKKDGIHNLEDVKFDCKAIGI